jgi:DNA-binding response OmpR family regulator
VAVIVLSVRGSEAEKVAALDAGRNLRIEKLADMAPASP